MTTKAERIRELDREFNSNENCRTGRMKVDEWSQRRAKLEALPDEPAPAPTPAPAPAQVRPVRKLMKDEDRARLAEIRAKLKAFYDANDADEAMGLYNSKECLHLYGKEAYDEARETLSGKTPEAAARIALMAANLARTELRELSAMHVARRRTLEKRIEQLEARESENYKRAAPLRWRGIWREDEEYSPGDAVTCDGALWFVHQTVKGERPGRDKKFQLMTKTR